MAEIKNVEAVIRALKDKIGEAENKAVIVGYTAPYALYVHENLEMKLAGKPRPSGLGVYWGPNGQPKFLEQPARENGKVYGKIIKQAMKGGATLEQALIMGGLALQRDSQLLVPVEHNNLRGSAFTRVET